jgi:hypothetical protein
VIKEHEEREVSAREETEYVYIEFVLAVSISIQIEEQISNREE